MRLNCALTSSFLFVLAVLADQDWAGVLYERYPGSLTLANGMFTVPNAQGGLGSALSIGVGLDGLTCDNFLAAGVNVIITAHGVVVEPWGQFYPDDTKYYLDGNQSQEFLISVGDELNITVQALSPTNAYFSIDNLTTVKSWSDTLNNDLRHPLCQQNAYWVVTLCGAYTPTPPLANFDPVIFTNLIIRAPANNLAPGNNVVPRNPTITNIQQNNQVMTSVQVINFAQSLSVMITYG